MKKTNQLRKLSILKLYDKSKSIILFALLITLFYTFSSCSNPYKNLTKVEHSEKDVHLIPFTLPSFENAIIYKADLSFYNNDFGGLLIIKRVEEKIYRIALTTQFGLKIFDFELSNGNLKVVFCIEQLNKKLILKTFEEDFNVLLMQQKFDHLFEIKNSELNQNIWQLNSGKSNTNYIQNNESNTIDMIAKMKRNSKKISVGLCCYKNELPGEINVNHHSIKFTMNLKLIQ